MQLSVIIVSYNVKYFLEQCLASVKAACKNIQAEIWVVDNNSEDGSRAYIEERFPDVNFIWQTVNPGFAVANNLALKKVTGAKVLFLNPDTILPENSLEKCLAFFDEQKNAGAAGIRMVDGSGTFLKESKRGFPSPLTSVFKLTGLAKAFPSSALFARYYLGHLPNNASSEAAVLSGAFMMVSKKVLDITGGFDEAFFMYGEDIDLSYRILQAGYKNLYFAGATIIHFKGESTSKNTAKYIKTFYGAMELFVKKHHAKSNALFYSILLKATITVKQVTGKFKPGAENEAVKSDLNFNVLKDVKTLIVAGPLTYILLKETLEKVIPSVEVVGRINNAQTNSASIGSLDQLSSIIKKYRVEHILFSTDEMVIDQIISCIQELPADIQFSWHLAGTKSIISSNDKNTSGFCIPLSS